VFLHSRIHNLLQIYHFQEIQSGFLTTTLSMDPILMGIAIPNAKRAMHLQLDPLKFRTQAQATSKGGPGNSYMEADIQFYQLSVTLPDLSVHQTIVYVPESEGKSSPHVVRSIDWTKVITPKHSLYASTDMDDERDFIVPDGVDALGVPTSKAQSQAPKLVAVEQLDELDSTVDYTLLYAALNSNPSAATEITDINFAIDRWKQVLTDSMSPVAGTL
jgi:hypothetical protein